MATCQFAWEEVTLLFVESFLPICVDFNKAAQRQLDQLLHPPKNNAVKIKLYREWAAHVLYEKLGLGNAYPEGPMDLGHVPTGELSFREQRVLELYRAGTSFNQIASTLNAEGVSTRRKGTMPNAVWRHRTVQLVLDRIRKKYPPPS